MINEAIVVGSIACFVSGVAMSYLYISWWLKRFLETISVFPAETRERFENYV